MTHPSPKIRKAVIPAAGFGTRFLPMTKAMPKEMLPVVDKPIIQYVVEEAVAAGVEDIIIVTGWHKRSIEDHFDYPFELEKRLLESGKTRQAEEVRAIAEMANFIYLRQKGPLGNATPIMNARPIIGDEPFLLLWGDDFIKATPNRSQQLIDAYHHLGGSVLSAIRTTNDADARRYGFVAGPEIEPGVVRVEKLIEKPGPERRPSDFAIVSGYLFTPEFFEAMDRVPRPAPGEEFVYIDVLNELIKDHPVFAVEIKDGIYYDTGNKLEYLKANIDFALARPDLGPDLRDYLEKIINAS